MKTLVMAVLILMLAAACAGPVGPAGEIGPQGERGMRGEEGPMGPQGERGLQGEVGPRGAEGPVGERGMEGAQGIQGEPGPQGERGEPGEQGEVGEKGEQGRQGPPGATGATGPTGPQGPRGPAGEQGPAGPAGFEVPQGVRDHVGLVKSTTHQVNGVRLTNCHLLTVEHLSNTRDTVEFNNGRFQLVRKDKNLDYAYYRPTNANCASWVQTNPALPAIGDRVFVASQTHPAEDSYTLIVQPATIVGSYELDSFLLGGVQMIVGMSGSPVFNADWQVVGILSYSYDNVYQNRSDGVFSYAGFIPVSSMILD